MKKMNDIRKKLAENIGFRNNVMKYTISLVLVLLIGALLVAIQGESPAAAVQAIIQGAFGSKTALGNSLRWSMPSILTGIAAAIAFKSGVTNLGVEGQLYFGALATAVAGYMVTGIQSAVLHTAFCILCGITAGVLYALIPALMRLLLRVDEMIATMMLNYIAVLATEFLTIQLMGISVVANPLSVETPSIAETATLPVLIKGTKANAGIFICLAVVLIIAALYKYFVKGYELKQVGENIRFSKLGGIKTRTTFISIFLISGAIGGLTGSVEVLGTYGKFTAGFSKNLGWDGVMIARIANNNPFGVLFVSLLWGVIKAGSLQMERMTNINRMTVTLLQAIFVMLITIDFSKLYDSIRSFFSTLKSRRKTKGGVNNA